MSDAALKELLARYGKDAMNDAEEENDAHAEEASSRRNPKSAA